MLRVKNIEVYIGSLYILQKISLELYEKETLFVIGSNGAGKTTLLKTIMGFYRPFSGSIEFRGLDITYLPPYERSKLGIRYAPDNRRLFTSLSVEDNLMIPLLADGLPKNKILDRIEYIYNLFPDLKRLRKLKASQLSGGQQQMLNIGRAIISPNTKILLLDEPVEGLSPLYVSKITNALYELAKEGISMIIVETRPTLMKKLEGRCIVLNGGRVVFDGTVEDLVIKQDLIKIYFG